MALLEINWNPSRRELRRFAGMLVGVIIVVVAIMVYRHGVNLPAIALAVCSLIVGAMALFFPVGVGVIYRVWMAAVFPIGWIVSHVAMATVYYLVITPCGLAMRLFGRDPLTRKFDADAESYWRKRNESEDVQRYFRQF
jgi:hypothetical protein